jgi:hypothetical protein
MDIVLDPDMYSAISGCSVFSDHGSMEITGPISAIGDIVIGLENCDM